MLTDRIKTIFNAIDDAIGNKASGAIFNVRVRLKYREICAGGVDLVDLGNATDMFQGKAEHLLDSWTDEDNFCEAIALLLYGLDSDEVEQKTPETAATFFNFLNMAINAYKEDRDTADDRDEVATPRLEMLIRNAEIFSQWHNKLDARMLGIMDFLYQELFYDRMDCFFDAARETMENLQADYKTRFPNSGEPALA